MKQVAENQKSESVSQNQYNSKNSTQAIAKDNAKVSVHNYYNKSDLPEESESDEKKELIKEINSDLSKDKLSNILIKCIRLAKITNSKKEIFWLENEAYGFDKNKNQLVAGTVTFENNVKTGYPESLRNPVFIDDIPKIILSLIKNNQTGTFHIAGQKKLKWLDFLKKLASLANAEDKVIIVDNSNWILKPPYDSSLATSKIESLGIKTTSFAIALKELCKQLLAINSGDLEFKKMLREAKER